MMNMDAASFLSQGGLSENLYELKFSQRLLIGYAWCLLPAGFLVGLFFDADDKGCSFETSVHFEWSTCRYIPE
jgi:hypothetical protein